MGGIGLKELWEESNLFEFWRGSTSNLLFLIVEFFSDYLGAANYGELYCLVSELFGKYMQEGLVSQYFRVLRLFQAYQLACSYSHNFP